MLLRGIRAPENTAVELLAVCHVEVAALVPLHVLLFKYGQMWWSHWTCIPTRTRLEMTCCYVWGRRCHLAPGAERLLVLFVPQELLLLPGPSSELPWNEGISVKQLQHPRSHAGNHLGSCLLGRRNLLNPCLKGAGNFSCFPVIPTTSSGNLFIMHAHAMLWDNEWVFKLRLESMFTWVVFCNCGENMFLILSSVKLILHNL